MTENSENVNKSLVELCIADLDKYATYDELEQRIYNSNENKSGLLALYNKVSNIINTSKYTEENGDELRAERLRLNRLIGLLYNL